MNCPECGVAGWVDSHEKGSIWDRIAPPAWYCPECGACLGDAGTGEVQAAREAGEHRNAFLLAEIKPRHEDLPGQGILPGI